MIRSRRDSDVAVLADLLIEQQRVSRYPYRWPLPFPAEHFLVREHEQAAWVAELDGTVVGHVMVASVESELSATVFCGRTNCTEPAVVSAMFVGDGVRGRGVGGVLLETAVAWARERGRVPVLDVVPVPDTALGFYYHHGLGGSRSAAAGSTGYPPMSLTSCRWPCHRSGPAAEPRPRWLMRRATTEGLRKGTSQRLRHGAPQSLAVFPARART